MHLPLIKDISKTEEGLLESLNAYSQVRTQEKQLTRFSDYRRFSIVLGNLIHERLYQRFDSAKRKPYIRGTTAIFNMASIHHISIHKNFGAYRMLLQCQKGERCVKRSYSRIVGNADSLENKYWKKGSKGSQSTIYSVNNSQLFIPILMIMVFKQWHVLYG